jgi:hypothetical protein
MSRGPACWEVAFGSACMPVNTVMGEGSEDTGHRPPLPHLSWVDLNAEKFVRESQQNTSEIRRRGCAGVAALLQRSSADTIVPVGQVDRWTFVAPTTGATCILLCRTLPLGAHCS